MEIQPVQNVQINEIEHLYKQVWNTSITERLQKHSTYEGFKGAALLTKDNRLIGFTYGYKSLPGQYYHGLLSDALPPDEDQYWLTDCFEVVELVVHPNFRRQGHAKVLLAELVSNINHKTAILTTQTDNHPARSFYESIGWSTVKEPFYPGATDKPYVIMGKDLPKL